MRTLLLTISLIAMAACAPKVPNSGAIGPVPTAPAEAAIPGQPIELGSVAISNEQDFGAVAGRETIESDAARIAANREQYQIVEPTALPTRSGGSNSSLVEFALATTNAVGESLYSRSSLFSSRARFDRNCAKYTSEDLAQEDFLKRGGPQRDSRGLDPDGDGFACYWTPLPYRQARASVAPPPVISTE